MRTYILVFGFLLTGLCAGQSRQSALSKEVAAIGFWNVENLYDTLNDRFKNDDDFTPSGSYAWTGERYRKKIANLAKVINNMATENTPHGLAILGLCEIENKQVLSDLVKNEQLSQRNYQFIHIEGPDIRGVDPALLYNPDYFQVQYACSYKVRPVSDTAHKTRDILVVSGLFGGDSLALLVNHWPSRRGGEMLSRPNRHAAATVVKHICDSIEKNCPATRILVMGDFNDDPVNASVKKVLGTHNLPLSHASGQFFNPMEDLYRKGIGSLAWQDSWNLFDQILLNSQWAWNQKGWHFYEARVYNKAYLRSDYGNFGGYPFRTFSGGAYTGGYSDHFAVYLILVRQSATNN